MRFPHRRPSCCWAITGRGADEAAEAAVVTNAKYAKRAATEATREGAFMGGNLPAPRLAVSRQFSCSRRCDVVRRPMSTITANLTSTDPKTPVWEIAHGTTRLAVSFVRAAGEGVAANEK